MGNYFGTENDFFLHEVELWGFDEIERLLNQGFKPVFTDKGWKWLLPSTEKALTLR
jgi:hypothetical protein